MVTATREEKHACAKRELGLRRTVYPKRVASGAMKADDADRETRVMEAIAADYATAAPPDLFSRPGDVAGPLKPCPFCGSPDATESHIRDGRQVGCRCTARGPACFHGPNGDTSDRAAAAWNARAAEAPAMTSAQAAVIQAVKDRQAAIDKVDRIKLAVADGRLARALSDLRSEEARAAQEGR